MSKKGRAYVGRAKKLAYFLKVMVALGTVITLAAQTAVLETGDRNRKGTGHCVQAFQTILYRNEPRGGLV